MKVRLTKAEKAKDEQLHYEYMDIQITQMTDPCAAKRAFRGWKAKAKRFEQAVLRRVAKRKPLDA